MKCAIKLSETEPHFSHTKEELDKDTFLNPLLFNIYINKLPKLFEQTQSDPFLLLPNGTTINSLLYADDLIVISSNCTHTSMDLRE